MISPNNDRVLAIVNLLAVAIQKILPWVLAIALAIAVRNAALSLSGQDTLFGAWIELTSRLKVTRGFAFVFGGLGISYGLQQRNLRSAETSRLNRRIAELEARLGSAGAGEASHS